MNLVYEGLKFMVLGMAVVFSFLVFLVFVLKLQAKILTKYFPQKEENAKCDLAPKKKQPSNEEDEVVAAITAAVLHHRKG